MHLDVDGHLGRQLRRRRLLIRLTQQQLAAVIGVRTQQIHKYEYGINKMSAVTLWRLAAVLEVPVEYFFEGLKRPSLQRGLVEPSAERGS